MAVGMRHHFIGFFGGCVEADRVINVVMLAEWHCSVATIHAGAAGKNQMLHRVVAATFQNVAKADQVGVDIGVWVVDGVAHPRLRGQMDDAPGLLSREQCRHRFAVGDVELVKTEVLMFAQFGKARLFESNVVVVVEVVHTNDRIASFKQAQSCVHTDEAGCASDEPGADLTGFGRRRVIH
jgi:hypothetical protein